MKKILITGADGQLGYELQRLLNSEAYVEKFSVLATDYQQLDITCKLSIDQYFLQNQPDFCINAAAYTAVDKAESEKETAYAINATGAHNLALACKQNNCQLIQVSTDFIFDGNKTAPYLEIDTPNPLSVYGETKLQGELLAKEALPSVCIVRTAWVYSVHGHNFVKTMLKLMSEKESLSVVCDQIGTPTNAANLAKALLQLIDVSAETSISGTFHFTDNGVASWYDFATAIQQAGLRLGILKQSIPVSPIPASAYPTPAARPQCCVLDKSKLLCLLGEQGMHWQQALEEMLENLIKVNG
ncbi:dTDP-4-dehydrorhamnose reductase [Pelagibaculum spongiae]|uniref:dTDP-4-dehydrorhamnose reductase n=1 Tax=Pelagibaculum spongiae TaxID=2080658 RepID=A0A2V1GY42_9GAMM|nr:dTDP-4-dehydrorhamnose reductase [Pelagibaculum spongiae]PVZ70247.1 dTDP-4-dehydrorhamnose reductase [Pelagibaculum spongiae]